MVWQIERCGASRQGRINAPKGPLLIPYLYRPRPLATSGQPWCSRGHRLILFLVFPGCRPLGDSNVTGRRAISEWYGLFALQRSVASLGVLRGGWVSAR